MHTINNHEECNQRFQAFITQLMNVSRLSPRNRYLYALMNTATFSDIETAVMAVILEYSEDAKEELKR